MGRFMTTGVWSLALVAGLALGSVRGAAAQVAAPTEPAAVLAAFAQAVSANPQQTDAALALIADDAVLTIIPAPAGTPGVWTGRESIKAALQYAREHAVRFDLTGAATVSGNTATSASLASNDFFQRLGVAPVQFSSAAVVEGGKIKSFTNAIAPAERGRVAAAAAGFQQAHPAAAADPAAVALSFQKAVGADVDAALALVADDAVLTITPPPPGTPGLWTGKAEIRQALQYSKDHSVTQTLAGSPQVSGNKVSLTTMASNSFFQQWGVAPVQYATEAVVEGGLIKSFSNTMAPSERARVAAAAQAYQAAQTPAGMPRTGGGDLFMLLMGLLAAGALCLAGGLLTRRAHMRP